MTTWTKLRDGSWGLKGAGLKEGISVTVQSKAGKVETVQVGRVLWTGSGIAIAKVAAKADDSRMGSYRSIGDRTQTRMDRTGWTGCHCGSIEGSPRKSDCFSCRMDY